MSMITGRHSQEPQRSTVDLIHAINVQPMKENEDVHLYLYNFEKSAELNGWLRENCAKLICPFLDIITIFSYGERSFSKVKQVMARLCTMTDDNCFDHHVMMWFEIAKSRHLTF